MGKLLRISDRIILGLAVLEDLFEDVHGVGGLAGYAYNRLAENPGIHARDEYQERLETFPGEQRKKLETVGFSARAHVNLKKKTPAFQAGEVYKTVYGFVPRKFKRRNFYAACLRRLSTGEIERVMVDGKPHLRLTAKGKKRTVRYFPLLKLREKKWDGFLRVVIFDIEEIKANLRNRFRRKLRELGFRMWQRSVWVSLLSIEEDFKEFLANNNLLGRVYILKDKGESIEDIKDFVWKVWKLDELEKRYEDFLDKYDLKHPENITFMEKQKIKPEFLEILAEDPLLPFSVLPKNWIGEKVRKLVKNL